MKPDKLPIAGVQQYSGARDIRSDYLKAAAIIGVVCIHVSLPFADAFRFCVPVFVAVWAFYFDRGLSRRNTQAAWVYVTRRFWGLFVPYLFWTVLYVSLFHSRSEWEQVPLHTLIGGWFGGYGWHGQYFFIILFQLTCLMPWFRCLLTLVACNHGCRYRAEFCRGLFSVSELNHCERWRQALRVLVVLCFLWNCVRPWLSTTNAFFVLCWPHLAGGRPV